MFEQTPPKGNAMLILITCHDDISEAIYGRLMETRKYSLIKVKDGIEVVRQARDKSPDLILMDTQLPLMDGFTATKQIRAFSPFHKTKIIFLSDFNNLEIKDAAIAAGGNEYLVKPFEFSFLQKTIDRYI
jgi:two-component system, sensor histidine kinase